ncbi:MAG: glycosyl transferase [Anaerolineales bacterium]|nr:hypothetical protein [Anaerolineales bacterium]MCB9144910.1 glycosyl transferase [Anaerolineales bacterium]
MKTLVFAPETINIAETTRMVEIAKAVRERFHCVFFGYTDKFSYLITEAGFEFKRMEPWLTDAMIEHLWKADRGETFSNPFSVDYLRQRVESETRLFLDLKPAAVVMGFTLSVTLSARVAGVPLVYVMPFPLTRPFLDAEMTEWPDMFDYPVLRIIPKSARKRWINNFFKTTKLWIRPFEKLSKEYGIKPIEKMLDLLEGDYNLITDIPNLTGVKDLPQNWQYVGPIFAHLSGDVPQEILNLPKDKPLIYCAMGSSANRAILRTVLKSFEGAPYTVIAPMKAHFEKEKLRVPSNVLLYDWLPAHKVNPLADVAVIHGGQGTVQTACASGTPFVGIGLQPEQEANIDMIVRQGSAIRLSKRYFTREKIIESIEFLLDDDQVRQRAKEIQTLSNAWDGTKNAAQFLIRKFGN